MERLEGGGGGGGCTPCLNKPAQYPSWSCQGRGWMRLSPVLLVHPLVGGSQKLLSVCEYNC